MMVYQIKKFDTGLEIDRSNEYRFAYVGFPIKGKVKKVANDFNYCVVMKEFDDGYCLVKVVQGPNYGTAIKLNRSMLKTPDLFPCLRKDDKAWLDSVRMLLSDSVLSDALVLVVRGALSENRMKFITAAFSNDKAVRDRVLSMKLIQDILEPYLGPFGLMCCLEFLKERVFVSDGN